MNQQAFLFYKSLKDNNDKEEVLLGLDNFKIYLANLCKNVCSNGLKDKFIHRWIFKHELGSEKDYENYCKANLFAATNSLERIKSQLEGKEINNVTRRILVDFVCDLKPCIDKFDKYQDYSWLIINTNSHISNFYYSLSNHIFFNGEPNDHPEEKLILSSSTPFTIRQSIEYKIKRILGIDYWLIEGRPDIQAIPKCFKAIAANKQYYKIYNLDFEAIKAIHSWTNVYIHGGYRPEPWRTETALFCLKDLFYSGQTSVKNSFSLYAGVEVLETDLQVLMKNTEEIIRAGNSKPIEIKWLSKPEVAIIKNKKISQQGA
ncbi:hypothetical protein TH63_02105 [Rufibacter radiotolerans]|uniref:Uncharacterized protein n=1 Tax=Rufibacter radiotolerans TaxID=1379910 RepID=A0A0H4VGG7_9BACT|nr:hypothetical protein [Rufibacter radiotolerans]AKQ44690.1 hypothetical protein TH63_02105 [Rufibacter radiotolerans]